MARLFHLLASVVVCAAVVGCSSGSDGESNAAAATSSIETSVTTPANDAGEGGTAPRTSLSLDELRDLDAEGIADEFIENVPGLVELTDDQVVCVREGVIELVDSIGVDGFIDGVETGVAGDPVPTALGEIGKRCGLQ